MIKDLLTKYPTTENSKRQSSGSGEAKPFLQWVGGKREFLANYSHYLPLEYNNYHEPFVGGGAVMFFLKSQHAFISDSNLELIEAYEGVRDNPTEIIALLSDLKSKHSKELYYAVRELDRLDGYKELSNVEKAARTIYLNQTGFNGVYRVNKKGQYNVPIGSSLNRLICDEKNILSCSNFLKNVNISHRDYSSVLDYAVSGDFIYLDPPYAPAGKYSDFVRYTKEQFSLEDQGQVAEVFRELDRRGCKVALANADVEIIHSLYSNYQILPVLSSRNLNSKKEARGKVGEVLVVNYKLERGN